MDYSKPIPPTAAEIIEGQQRVIKMYREAFIKYSDDLDAIKADFKQLTGKDWIAPPPDPCPVHPFIVATINDPVDLENWIDPRER